MAEVIKFVVACKCSLNDPVAYIDDHRPTGGRVTITAPTPEEKQIISATGYHPEIEDWRAPDSWVASNWGTCKVTEIMWAGRDERGAVIGWVVRCGQCSQQAQINQANLDAITAAADLSQLPQISAPKPVLLDDSEGSYGDDGWFEPVQGEIVREWEHRYLILLGVLIDESQRNR